MSPKSQQRLKVIRHPMKATVETTGRCVLNATSSLAVTQLAKSKGLESGYHVVLGVDEKAGLVALYVVPVTTPDSILLRSLRNGLLGLSLADVLDDVPDLRPTTRVKCSAVEMVDDAGEACVALCLGAQITHLRRPVAEAAPAAAPKQA